MGGVILSYHNQFDLVGKNKNKKRIVYLYHHHHQCNPHKSIKQTKPEPPLLLSSPDHKSSSSILYCFPKIPAIPSSKTLQKPSKNLGVHRKWVNQIGSANGLDFEKSIIKLKCYLLIFIKYWKNPVY